MTPRATVLAYHAVGTPPPGSDPHNLFVSPAAFAAQLAFLAAHRRVVPLELAVGAAAGDRRAVALTFDDAYRHLLDAALPLLERHRFPATLFVPTGWTGRRNGWDEPTEADLRVMSDDEVRTADLRGLRAQSHGHVHLDCRTAPAAAVEADLRASQERLADLVGRRPRYLAWPFRDGSPAARQVAQRLGFERAFSIDLLHAGPFSYGRVQVVPTDGPALFRFKTSGRYLAARHGRAPALAYRTVRRLLAPR